MLLFSDQLMTLYKSFWSLATSCSLNTGMETRVSSTGHLIIDMVMQCSIMLMNIKNKTGPSTAP